MLYENEALGISTIIAENRQKRPNKVKGESMCPFCKQNESAIEQVVMETFTSDEDHIRIVNNKYPVCHKRRDLYGIHDVVIETLYHDRKPHSFSKSHWYDLIKLIQLRWLEISQDERIQFIQVFKNEGEKAGASIMHSHWQIIALEETLLTMKRHYESVREQYEKEGCWLCKQQDSSWLDIIKTSKWRLTVPEGARAPYESWIVPNIHFANLGQITDDALKELALLLSDTLKLYERMLPEVSYNICVMSGKPKGDQSYHFYISLLPRTGNFAGFELATGCYINILSPKGLVDKMKELVEEIK